MVSGFFPFTGINETQLHKSILSGKFPKPNSISKELMDLINKILELNPNKRIKLDEILNHPWLKVKKDINDDILNKENLFAKAEKIIYYNLRKNYKDINNNDEGHLEHFTYRNIDTDYQDENLNNQTISDIITPYNSKRENNYDPDLYYDDINIEKDIVKYLPIVNELNKLYEINNNSDFDQGYMFNKKENYQNKIMNSFNESYIKKKIEQKNKNNDIKINIKENNKIKLIDINNEIENLNRDDNNEIKNKEINLDESIIKYIENLGYKKEYIIKSLELNELNYATATYYLKLSLNDD
jgi:serine/threonine protein kinase